MAAFIGWSPTPWLWPPVCALWPRSARRTPQGRRREVRLRLPFDDDTTIDVVIADGETLHPNVEITASPREIKQRSVPFRKVHAKAVSRFRCVRRAGDTVLGISDRLVDVTVRPGPHPTARRPSLYFPVPASARRCARARRLDSEHADAVERSVSRADASQLETAHTLRRATASFKSVRAMEHQCRQCATDLSRPSGPGTRPDPPRGNWFMSRPKPRAANAQ